MNIEAPEKTETEAASKSLDERAFNNDLIKLCKKHKKFDTANLVTDSQLAQKFHDVASVVRNFVSEL